MELTFPGASSTGVSALLWVAALAIALFSSEKLVQGLSGLGRRAGFSAGILGLLVALGADGPEITSALIALSQGAQQIGLGVVVGSNIYNLAGLLGFAAVLAGGIHSDRFRVVLDGGGNIALTLALVVLVEVSSLHAVVGVVLLLLLAIYVALTTVPRGRFPFAPPAAEAGSPESLPSLTMPRVVLTTIAAAAGIIVASDLLVQESIRLGPQLHIPTAAMATFILPIATSLPNTWAAVSLARKRLGRAAIAATFNSNSINAAIGAGIPSLFFAVHATTATRTIDVGWLLGMTTVAILLLLTRTRLARWEGGLLLGLYGLFVALRLTFFA